MKKFPLVLAVAASMLVSGHFTGSGGRAAQDGRMAIALPSAARDAVLAEMRAMLRALNGILIAMEAEDRDGMKRAAESGGMAIAADTDPAVGKRLPSAFVQLGVSTHQAFDSLAASIENGAETDEIVGELAALTSKCVACHATYRIVVER